MSGLRLTGTDQIAPKLPVWFRILHPRRALSPAQALGQRGEDLAFWFLKQHGYTIVARNYRGARKWAGAGEIDLIAVEGEPPVLVFVEVKARAREGLYPAEAAVDRAKRRHLVHLARSYRALRRYSGPYRFDIVVVYGTMSDGSAARLKLHRGAFRA
ncbi:MAG: YraN family protein [Terriglobales bacterium]